MAKTKSIGTYSDALTAMGSPKTKYLLLGNGFSISCDKIFSYPNLFEIAKADGLSEQAIKVFDYMGTNNFEGVMNLLEQAQKVAKIYGLKKSDDTIPNISDDLKLIKDVLVKTIAKTHLPFPSSVNEASKDKCAEFFNGYKGVFTTNYDLLPYWVAMHAGEKLKTQDGFRASEDDPESPYLVFSERVGQNRGLYFVHGALHIYLASGETRKHSWKRHPAKKRLVELVLEGLTNNQFPLFVAEGNPEKKLQQINRSAYLSYCFGKLGRIESPLVIYGHSLGESDSHISDSIARNEQLASIAIGIFGDPSSLDNVKLKKRAADMRRKRSEIIKKRSGKDLQIEFYDSSTAPVW